MATFIVEKVKKEVIQWIRDWFEDNGEFCNAIIGISGGKDSTVAAKLCVEALGKENVIGILMPCGTQQDIEDSYKVCELLGIKYYEHNIADSCKSVLETFDKNKVTPSKQTIVNLPARIRMSVLYAYAQSLNGRVVCTSNKSEEWIGYFTRWGDGVGDFAPLADLTVNQVMQLGDSLGLPYELVHKTPIDGLTKDDEGNTVTDEDNIGIPYKDIDYYLEMLHTSKKKRDKDWRLKIDHNSIKNLIKKARFKNLPIPKYEY